MSFKRFLRHEGVEVDITTYTEDGTDSYGDPTFSTNTETVDAWVTSVVQSTLARRKQLGQDVKGDVLVFVSDEVSVSDGSGSGYPSEVTHGSQTYEVQHVLDMNNEMQRLTCRLAD